MLSKEALFSLVAGRMTTSDMQPELLLLCRTLEDVKTLADDDSQTNTPPLKLSKEARFSLEHADDILAGCSEADVLEMHRVVVGELNSIAGEPGLRLTRPDLGKLRSTPN